MLWLEHIACGYMIRKYLFPKTNFADMVIGSVLPDVPMILFLWYHHWRTNDVDRIDIQLFYFFPHSMLSLPLIPQRWLHYYILHIFCDIISHTKEWSIRPFFPLSSFYIEGFYDPWKLFQPSILVEN